MEVTEKTCCIKMEWELSQDHIKKTDDNRWFLNCMNPISYCPFCGILLTDEPPNLPDKKSEVHHK